MNRLVQEYGEHMMPSMLQKEPGPATTGATRSRIAWLALLACGLSSCAIDRSISVDDNRENKTYRIIDGDLDVQRKASIGDGWVVDGNVSLHEGSLAKGDISLTDGRLIMESGSTVEGRATLRHVNINLRGAVIEGDVDTTCTGGQLLATRIDGELRIRDKALWYKDCEQSSTLTIGPGSEIGQLRIESDRIDVRIQDGATIHTMVNDVVPAAKETIGSER